jgi:hypothetical protein
VLEGSGGALEALKSLVIVVAVVVVGGGGGAVVVRGGRGVGGRE